SPELTRAIERSSVRVALTELRNKYPSFSIELQPRNNPGFDVLVSSSRSAQDLLYVEVKGTQRHSLNFFATEGEIQFSRRNADAFCIILVYGIAFDTGAYQILWHSGAIRPENGFRLTPIQWACELASSKGP